MPRVSIVTVQPASVKSKLANAAGVVKPHALLVEYSAFCMQLL